MEPVNLLIFRQLGVLTCALFFWFFSAPVVSGGEDAWNACLRFFHKTAAGKYMQAYDIFSGAVKERLPFIEFKSRAKDIKYFKILDKKSLDNEASFSRYFVKARLRVVYHGGYYEAVYEGKVDMHLRKGEWKVIAVKLKPVSQKLLKKTGAVEQPLEEIDFGPR